MDESDGVGAVNGGNDGGEGAAYGAQEAQVQMEADLFKAVVDDDQDKLEELISNGANVDTIFEDYTGVSTKSILHICCEKDRLACARILLQHGAYVNMRDSWGQTPLMYCMITQVQDIAEVLLSKDPTIVDHQDRFGKTPLHCAVESDSIESMQLLLKYNAKVYQHTSDGITAVMTAVTLTSEVENSHEMLQMMLDAGYDLEMKDFRSKRTALQMAVIAKNPRAVELLLAAGADVNTMDSAWRTPLTNAIFQFARKPPGQATCVVDPLGKVIIEMLTQSKADLNMTLVEYCNPLIASAFVDSAVLAQYFLENGSDVDVRFQATGSTPLIISTTRNNFDAFTVFLRWNCDLAPKGHIQRRRKDYFFDVFELAVFLGHLHMVEPLVEAGYNLQTISYLKNPAPDDDVPTPLQEAPDLLHWLREAANNPRPLSAECVICIRRALRYDVERKIASLSMPSKLQDMVTLANVLKPKGQDAAAIVET